MSLDNEVHKSFSRPFNVPELAQKPCKTMHKFCVFVCVCSRRNEPMNSSFFSLFYQDSFLSKHTIILYYIILLLLLHYWVNQLTKRVNQLTGFEGRGRG